MALVALRVGLGFHFFYEGVWKIRHADEFSAEPFLTQAKGPAAPVFYGMIPDLNGRERLAVVKEKDESGKEIDVVTTEAIAQEWERLRKQFVSHYGRTEEEKKRLGEASAKIYKTHLEMLKAYFKENLADIKGYFNSLDRFEHNKEAGQDAPFQSERRWNEMMKLRAEAKKWLVQREVATENFEQALLGLRNDEQKARGPLPFNFNVFTWDRVSQINLAVTFGLTAIGLCLILGFFTRLAALGGAAFMCFVVATQPAFPTIYPPDPAVVGHALLINKDFIELLSLLVIATTAVGRWGGLDYFLHTLILDPILSRRMRNSKND